MSANIKIGNDTLQGVDAVELENADALGSYVKFGLGISGGYTVTFVAEGNPYSIISVTAGSAIKEPIPPEVTGTVQAWSTDEAGANFVSFPYTPTSDITLYAKVSAPKTIEESTWAEIAQVSANKSWDAMGWQVGDSKTITLNGTVGTLALNNYQCKVYIIGFDHNADKEGQGISFGMLEGVDGKQLCLTDQYYNTNPSEVMAFSMNTTKTNAGGWKASKMRKTILGSTDVENGDATPDTVTNPATNTLMAALPADLLSVYTLKQAKADALSFLFRVMVKPDDVHFALIVVQRERTDCAVKRDSLTVAHLPPHGVPRFVCGNLRDFCPCGFFKGLRGGNFRIKRYVRCRSIRE